MLLTELPTAALVVLSSLSSAVVIFWMFGFRRAPQPLAARMLLESSERSLVFLFDDENLADATEPAQLLLRASSETGSDWSRLTSVLADRFPTLRTDLQDLGATGLKIVASVKPNDKTTISAEWWDDLVRLELRDPEITNAHTSIESETLRAMEIEIGMLRSVAEATPYLVWQQDKSGTVTWANAAYLECAARLRPKSGRNSWPPEQLFNLPATASPQEPVESIRLPMIKASTGETTSWFDCYVKDIGERALCFAVDANDTVRAESTLQEFVQTLSKTFAHLHVGLAVFDRKRQLALFNPAMTDLMDLPVEFLASRPTLHAVLDHLRDKRKIPEPKDYGSWRQHIAALEAAAIDGTYEETWSLSSGRTYRMSGRPHPNGAIAFQFEDISSEISLTRHFRSELELGQAVIDCLPEAIAVFSSDGSVSMSNQAYADLWGHDPGKSVGETKPAEAISKWQSECSQTPIWAQVSCYLNMRHNRKPLADFITLKNGQRFALRLEPLAGGATFIGFRRIGQNQTSPTPQFIRSAPIRA